MTLCKYRPQRAYDAQFVFEQNDVNGLMKKLSEAAERVDENRLQSAPYYKGALIAFDVMFNTAESNGHVDMWADFLTLFEQALEETEDKF